jgi:serine/threonine protein kinase
MTHGLPAGSAGIDLRELVEYVEASGRMGTARLETSIGPARLWFRDGELVDAEAAGMTAEAAVTRLLAARVWSYAIEYKPIARFPALDDAGLALLGKAPRRAAERQRLIASMPAIDSILSLNAVRFERESASLAELDLELLSLLDGRRTLAEVVHESGLGPPHAFARLAWYFRTGLIRLVSTSQPPSYPPPREGDHTSSAPPEPGVDDWVERTRSRLRIPPLPPVRTVEGNAGADAARAPSQAAASRRLRSRTEIGLGVPAPPTASEAPGPTPAALGRRATMKLHGGVWPSPEPIGPLGGAHRPSPRSQEGAGRQGPLGTGAVQPEDAPNPFPSLQGTMKDGRVLVGRYEILSRIARGGMGAVYLCRSSGEGGFHRLFALKVLRSHLVRDAAATERFLQEARIAARIYDPHVVGIIDVGSQGGQPFIVMEYVEGGSLHELLRRHPRYRTPRLIIPLILDALSGLHAVHTLADERGVPLGLVHCDVSPQNLLVGVDGHCRLSDFGVARWRTGEGAKDVRHGKPAYVAPEQVSGAALDARTDLFSMGVVLWTALTGEPLFEASTHEATLANVLRKPVPRPSDVGRRPPACFDRVCHRALSRDPARRYASAREMLDELRAVALAEGHLASATEVAEWIQGTFRVEIQQQRLGALERSRLEEVTATPAERPRTGSRSRDVASESSHRDAVQGDGVESGTTLALPMRRPNRTVLVAAAVLGVVAIAVTMWWPERIAGWFQVESAADVSVGVLPSPPAVRAHVPRIGATEETGSPHTGVRVPRVAGSAAASTSRFDHYVPTQGVE